MSNHSEPLPSQPAERDDRRAEVEAATRAERHAEYLDTMADVIMDSGAAGKLEAKSVMMKAAKFIREIASTIDTLTADRDAAFAMSRCECEVNEACRNLAVLTAERDCLKARVAELQKALEPFADISDLMDAETEGFDMSDKLTLVVKDALLGDYVVQEFPLRRFYAARQALKGEHA